MARRRAAGRSRRWSRRASERRTTHRSSRRWVREVKTVSTYPPEGLFNRDARTIARSLASKRVSPKGIGSGIRMLQFYINRGGRGLSPTRRAELERAKRLLKRLARKEPAGHRRGR